MRLVLGVLCAFTILAVGWLFIMFLVLRHPGFAWRAALCVPVIALSLLTLLSLRRTTSVVLGVTIAAGAVVVSVAAGWAFIRNSQAGPGGFEGYLAVITAALVLQGLLTLACVCTKRST